MERLGWAKLRGALDEKRVSRCSFAQSRGRGRNGALVALVARAAPQNWQAAMTMLERKYPDRWGRRARSDEDASEAGTTPWTPEELAELSDEEIRFLEAIAIRRAKRSGGGGKASNGWG